MTKGTFIVLYGINNLGKSTQAKLLVEKMNAEGHKTEYLKYPIYDLAPSGPMINAYLREKNPHSLSAREIQLLYAMNRTQFETTLKEKLTDGVHIVAEDYTGTGLCWGIGAGVDETFMREINSHLLAEDIAFLFEGKRFVEATEQGHKHETNDDLLEKVTQVHKRLGEELGWISIQANESIESIRETIWQRVTNTL